MSGPYKREGVHLLSAGRETGADLIDGEVGEKRGGGGGTLLGGEACEYYVLLILEGSARELLMMTGAFAKKGEKGG